MYKFCRGVAQFGSALGLGPRGRRFESCHPDHKETLWITRGAWSAAFLFCPKLSYLFFILIFLKFYKNIVVKSLTIYRVSFIIKVYETERIFAGSIFLAIIIFGILSARKEYIMDIKVCIGSSCHLRGSYDIINLMKDALKENGLDETVGMSAAFCLGHCGDGVSIKVDDQVISGVTKENFNEIFSRYVLNTVN